METDLFSNEKTLFQKAISPKKLYTDTMEITENDVVPVLDLE